MIRCVAADVRCDQKQDFRATEWKNRFAVPATELSRLRVQGGCFRRRVHKRIAPPIGPHVLSQRPGDSCIMVFFRPLRAAVVCGSLGQLQKENVG